ncbi:MAG: hypothetical protein QOD76_677 [Solirubrobacteraceae bacterium]|nr:hypothetical protein [Solirubrobacteraceae bacterium]
MNDRTPSQSGRRRGSRHGRSRRAKGSGRERPAVSREERKLKTRQDLLQAALRLLENRSFDSLSLREVTREAGVVPTAFYRHFEDMDQLGLALVEDSFGALRQMLREVRSGPLPATHMIRSSIEVLVNHVRENRLHFRFIVRERYAGVSALRHAIRSEIRLLTSELATDLARLPYLRDWPTDDLQMMAGLMVNAVVSTAEAIVDSSGGPEREEEVIRTTEHQLRLIALGVPHWKTA